MLISLKKVKETFKNEENFVRVSLFLAQAIIVTAKNNPENWSLLHEKGKIRLHSGGFKIFTLYSGKVWCALDKESMHSEEVVRFGHLEGWKWDDGTEKDTIVEYSKHNKFSRNGYLFPNKISEEDFLKIEQYHYTFIEKIGKNTINVDTKNDCNKELIRDFSEITGMPLPNPI